MAAENDRADWTSESDVDRDTLTTEKQRLLRQLASEVERREQAEADLRAVNAQLGRERDAALARACEAEAERAAADADRDEALAVADAMTRERDEARAEAERLKGALDTLVAWCEQGTPRFAVEEARAALRGEGKGSDTE